MVSRILSINYESMTIPTLPRVQRSHIIFFTRYRATLYPSSLSQIAVDQLEQVEHLLSISNVDETQNDVVLYSWGSSNYSSKKAYNQTSVSNPASPLFHWLSTASNIGTHKFFFWVLLRDRLNSWNLLRRKKHANG